MGAIGGNYFTLISWGQTSILGVSVETTLCPGLDCFYSDPIYCVIMREDGGTREGLGGMEE